MARQLQLSLTFLFVTFAFQTPTPISSRKLLGKEKLTNLHFFLHDSIGAKPTAAIVVKPHTQIGKVKGVTPFGSVTVMDDPLTTGPELTPASVVGNAQGLYVSTGQDSLSLVMAVDFTFTAGKHRGGSFSVMSRNAVAEGDRELAIVGGRGKFRFARGFAAARTTGESGDTAVIEYNVTLLHH